MNRLINTLERWLKTDIRYLLKGGFWLAVGQFFASAAALILSIAFANLLSPDVYGIYKYILSLVGVMAIASLSGIDTAYAQAVARAQEGGYTKYSQVKFRWSLLGSIAGLSMAGYYAIAGNHWLSIPLVIASLFMPFMNSLTLYNAYLNGKKDFKKYSLYNITTQIVSASVLIITIFFTKNIISIIAAYFITYTALNFIFYNLVFKKHTLNNELDSETIPYGKHLSVMDLINVITNHLDKILVFQYLGAVELAIYTIAVAPTEQMKGLLKNINFLAMPKFAVRTKEEIKADIFNKLLKLGSFVAVASIMYVLIAPVVFPIIFPKYAASIYYSQIIAISIVPAILSTFLYTIFKAQAMTKELYQYNIYSNLFGIIVLVPLTLYFGLLGTILARVLSRFFLLSLSLVLIKRM
jgi:O-antigen/teichoic acid export membrane protein